MEVGGIGIWQLIILIIIAIIVYSFWAGKVYISWPSKFKNNDSNVITTGDWVIVYLIMCIPLVNIIMLFVWAFGGGTPASKANWAKATLIWFVIVFILTLLVLAAST